GTAVVIKDHLVRGLLARETLRFMDVVGNARHGVALPFHYWTRPRWESALGARGAHVEAWRGGLPPYPWWGSWVLGRSLHSVARVSPAAGAAGAAVPRSHDRARGGAASR